MSGFTAAAVEALDFDFTAIPRVDGQGLCTAKGVVSEPTEDRLEAFFLAVSQLGAPPVPAEGEDPVELTGTEAFAKVRVAMHDFCAGSPTPEDIDLLPPRFLMAFVRWLTASFGQASPKA